MKNNKNTTALPAEPVVPSFVKIEVNLSKETDPQRVPTESEIALIRELAKEGCLYITENTIVGSYSISIKPGKASPHTRKDVSIELPIEVV